MSAVSTATAKGVFTLVCYTTFTSTAKIPFNKFRTSRDPDPSVSRSTPCYVQHGYRRFEQNAASRSPGRNIAFCVLKMNAAGAT